MTRTLVAYHPGINFPAVSLTGGACGLQCEHCRGHHLLKMSDGSRPGDLLKIAAEAKAAGATGILVSGGCDRDGKVPLLPRLDEMTEVKRIGMALNIHTGLLDVEEAVELARIGDVLSMDLHQSPNIIRDVLHIRSGPDSYERTLEVLCEAAPERVVPHICAGLEGDSNRYEMMSVDLAAKYGAAGLVILVHVPTPGTPLRPEPPIGDETVLGLIDHAVSKLNVPVMLGCMRPRKDDQLEIEAARHGVSGIANPKERTLKVLAEEGYQITHRNECCALHL